MTLTFNQFQAAHLHEVVHDDDSIGMIIGGSIDLEQLQAEADQAGSHETVRELGYEAIAAVLTNPDN